MSRHGRHSTAPLLVTAVAVVAALGTAALVPRVEERVVAIAAQKLRPTGLPQLISFYKHIAFDLPRIVTGTGVVLLLGMATIRLYLLATGSPPAYLAAYFALIGACVVVASLAMLAGRWPRVVAAGWWFGSLIALATFAMYIASRTAGLPGLGRYVSRWDFTYGTAGIALSVGFLAVHFTVLTGMNVAYPHRQQWTD